MSSDTFDGGDGRFFVLVNGEQQYSLWPSFTDAPADWRIVFGAASRDQCLSYVEERTMAAARAA
ncbi:MbtH family protein [Streptomyces sp. NPDC046909]|uniref:MbtH family protein n=1 Tax=Streptomyces sp. NPDC046909 TaxID=3155617 RepID=UPI0033FF6A96